MVERQFINSSGNFTHVKISGSLEERSEYISNLYAKYRENDKYKNMTDMEKNVLTFMLSDAAYHGFITMELILELTWPSR